MTIARRLWLVLALNVALLSGLAVFHLRALHRVVAAAEQLTEVSAQVVLAQARQSERIALLDETLAKYAITNDAGYLDKSRLLRAEFETELARTSALPVHQDERTALQSVGNAWRLVNSIAATFPRAESGVRVSAVRLSRMQVALDSLRMRVDALGAASQVIMRTRLDAANVDANRAERVSWIAAGSALLLAIVSGLALRRSITKPLHALSLGTQSVAQGQFDHRLQTEWGTEFRQVAAAFNAMTERLDELDRMKREFVTMVSHDLKSPLASLRETNSLLLDEVSGPLGESQRRVLLLQRESADRLGVMIAKLLDLSRLEAGLPLQRERIAVRTLLEASVLHAQVHGRERQVRVQFARDLDPGIVVQVDIDRFRQLVDNLLENATKFSPDGAVVEVDAAVSGQRVILTVADRGPGVASEDRVRIFDRFYQTAAGRAVRGRGAGLGLTICREVVQAHGGRISVYPRDGGGSIFAVELVSVARANAQEVAA